jgi:hypothetical protein
MNVKGVGPKLAGIFNKIGIYSAEDLLKIIHVSILTTPSEQKSKISTKEKMPPIFGQSISKRIHFTQEAKPQHRDNSGK